MKGRPKQINMTNAMAGRICVLVEWETLGLSQWVLLGSSPVMFESTTTTIINDQELQRLYDAVPNEDESKQRLFGWVTGYEAENARTYNRALRSMDSIPIFLNELDDDIAAACLEDLKVGDTVTAHWRNTKGKRSKGTAQATVMNLHDDGKVDIKFDDKAYQTKIPYEWNTKNHSSCLKSAIKRKSKVAPLLYCLLQRCGSVPVY